MSPKSALLCLVATTVLGPRAFAQPGSPVYPDDSPAAAAGLAAVDRLLASGNADEAVRTLQTLLADEGDRVVAVVDDEDLFVGVRGAVHERLLARPELLKRYRETYSPQAQSLLDTGRIEDLERVYLLTPAGYEAALRLAQQRLESARFNAALITLNQLDAHPDRVGESGRGAAMLAAQLARYLPRPEVVELATRWSADSDAGAPDLEPYERPAKADRTTFTPMTTGEALDGDAIPPTPMWTVPLEDDGSIQVRRPSRRTVREPRPGLWTHPTIAGQILLVNDTVWIRAWDRYTLEPLWRVKPGVNGQGSAQLLGEAWEQRTSDTVGHIQIEDTSSVSVWGDVVVAVTGFARDGLRFGDGRVHGLDLRTGATRWSVSPGAGDGPLDHGTARGPVLVDEGMAVVAIRRSARTRRVVSFLLMGIDALSGEVRW
ncbi:MAG: hypothetical protein IID31_04970, partial [Planctomycetes bacterium]|nr:hypothetical protein [Planctomycetota bacterium]